MLQILTGGVKRIIALLSGDQIPGGENRAAIMSGLLSKCHKVLFSSVAVTVLTLFGGVAINAEAQTVSVGETHTCAVVSGGVRCWGDNTYGQLGNGTNTSSTLPVQVQGLANGVTAVSSGVHTSCALVNSGVQCWGSNQNGQLGVTGRATNSNSNVPVPVSGLATNVSAISVGSQFACAVVGGSARCWGNNGFGQLGNAATGSFSDTAVQVSGLTSGVSMVDTGGSHACALVSGGARCWGRNNYGQLGNGGAVDSNVPVQVTALTSGVVSISAGTGSQTCAAVNGAAKCWGWNTYGQLGTGNTSNVSIPTAISSLSSGVTSVSTGGSFSCAIANGAGSCWGNNGGGQLGNNSNVSSNIPVAVSSLSSGVASIGAGEYRSCVVLTSGVLKCWGPSIGSVPVEVLFAAATTPQSIIFPAIGDKQFVAGASFAISATSSSGLPVTFSTSAAYFCTVTGSTVTMVNSGSCTITANQTGNTTYAAATPVSQTISLIPPVFQPQTITFNGALSQLLPVGGTFTVTATASSGLPVSLSSQTPAVCSIAGTTVTVVGAGRCTIQGDQAGNATYSAGYNIFNVLISIILNTQTISLNYGPSRTLAVNGTFSISATATSGLPVTFSTSTTGICTVSGNIVTVVSGGNCQIDAYQGGNANYSSAAASGSVFITIASGQTSQTITFNFGSARTLPVGGTFSISATASSGLPVTFTSFSTGVCTVSGSTVTVVSGGTCRIEAAQAGNATYAAISGTSDIFITIGSSPTVTGVTPATAVLNQLTTFTVSGTNLTAGMGFTIANCELSNIEVGSGTSSQRTFQCTPKTFTGSQAGLVKTAPNGTTLSTFTVNVTATGPTVTGVTPTTAVLNQLTTFTVSGTNLTAGMGFTIANCEFSNIEVGSGTSSQRTFQCTPKTFTGSQAGLVKTAPNGTTLNTFTVNVTATSPTVTGVTPIAARLDVAQDFTVVGTNLTSVVAFTIEDCEPESGPGPIPEIGTGTATLRTYRCVPRLPGPKHVTVKTGPGGTVLFTSAASATAGAVPIAVDHPARLGEPGSRRIPAVDAVSLWNGNVHLSATDLAVPGKGVSFALTRSYNSYDWPYEASRGGVSNAAPWRFNWDLSLGYLSGSTTRLWVQREDGAGENFFMHSDGKWYPVDQGNFNKIQGDTPVAGQTSLFTREGLKYIFQNPDLGGKLISIFDHDGNGLTITRDGSGRVASITDASGRLYTFSYDANGRLARVADFSGRYVDYTWETSTSPASVRLKTVRDVRGGTTTYNYTTLGSGTDAKVFLSSIVDPRGNTARTFAYANTVYGNWGAISIKDAANATWNFSYCARQADSSCGGTISATSFQTTMTPPLGAVTVTRFDTGGRFVEMVDANSQLSRTVPIPTTGLTSSTYNLAALPQQQKSALGVTGNYGTSYAYTSDNAGNLATKTDALGNATQRTWLNDALTNIAKNLQRVTQLVTATGATHAFGYTSTSAKPLSYTPPGLPTSTLSYNTDGTIHGFTDGRGYSGSRGYDTNGNLRLSVDAYLYAVQYTHDSLGRVLTTKDKRNNVTTQTWDAAGNLLTLTDALNGVTTNTYDANGNRITMTDARGNLTSYSYDANNRLKTTSRALGAQTLTTTYNYDVLGRMTSVTNANSHTSTTSYDGEGNVLTRANALAFTTQYQYDADNRLIKTTDPENRVTSTVYDQLGRVSSVTTAAGTLSYAYDADSRMTASTDPRGKVTQYGYDAAGRLTSVTDANNKVTSATYDANGNLLSVADPKGHTTSYTYDALNRPLTRTDANGQQWSTTYDANGNVITRTVPGNKTTSYTYDELDRVSRVAYPDASVVSFNYDANGNRTSMTDSTGTTSYTHDTLNRMASKTDPQGKAVTYAYDGIGNVQALGYPGGQAVTYAYDAGERLTSLTDWLNKTTSYTLDKSGQVTAALFGNLSRADMVYDAAGRLTSLINKKPDGSVISSHQLTLDGNGNITNAATQLPLEPSLPNVNRVFTYDNANRLATYNSSAVTHDDAGRITSLAGAAYSYNDRDQITGITGSQTASHAYNGDGHRVMRTIGGQVTHLVIDANRGLPEVIAETDNAGTVQRRYVYGYGLVEQIDGANAASYYHFDPTGSTLALTNGSGVMTDSYAYTPYGETTTTGTTINPFRYVGKLGVMDDGNGMQYMRARYYRPDVARFMSLDALPGSSDKPQSLNRYGYVLGNPVMEVDPSGFAREGYSQYSGCTKVGLPDMSCPDANQYQSPSASNQELYEYGNEIGLGFELMSVTYKVGKGGKIVVTQFAAVSVAGKVVTAGLTAQQVAEGCKNNSHDCFVVVAGATAGIAGGAAGAAICAPTVVGSAVCAYIGGVTGEYLATKFAVSTFAVFEKPAQQYTNLNRAMQNNPSTLNWFISQFRFSK